MDPSTTIRVLSYGGGVNSTALLVEAVRRAIPINLILFADTGDERPETYSYVETFSSWLVGQGYPAIETVRWIRRDGSFIPLGALSLRNRELPSKAYGFSGCTTKWKQQPLDKRVREWANGAATVERWIGYDADEPERARRMLEKNPQPPGGTLAYAWRCPLVEWDMGRAECEAAILAAGLPSPGKSSCYFCPSMRRAEIDALAREHPDLVAKALEIEDAARPNLVTVKGLGRSFSWREYLAGQTTEGAGPEQDCGCYDG